MSQSLKALWVRVCVGGKFPGCLLFIHFALAVWAVRLCLHHYHLHINARKHRPAFNHLFMGLIYYLRELLGGQVGKHAGHACCAAPPSVFTCRAWRAAHNWGQAVAIWSIVECRLEFFEPRSSFLSETFWVRLCPALKPMHVTVSLQENHPCVCSGADITVGIWMLSPSRGKREPCCITGTAKEVWGRSGPCRFRAFCLKCCFIRMWTCWSMRRSGGRRFWFHLSLPTHIRQYQSLHSPFENIKMIASILTIQERRHCRVWKFICDWLIILSCMSHGVRSTESQLQSRIKTSKLLMSEAQNAS